MLEAGLLGTLLWGAVLWLGIQFVACFVAGLTKSDADDKFLAKVAAGFNWLLGANGKLAAKLAERIRNRKNR